MKRGIVPEASVNFQKQYKPVRNETLALEELSKGYMAELAVVPIIPLLLGIFLPLFAVLIFCVLLFWWKQRQLKAAGDPVKAVEMNVKQNGTAVDCGDEENTASYCSSSE